MVKIEWELLCFNQVRCRKDGMGDRESQQAWKRVKRMSCRDAGGGRARESRQCQPPNPCNILSAPAALLMDRGFLDVSAVTV